MSLARCHFPTAVIAVVARFVLSMSLPIQIAPLSIIIFQTMHFTIVIAIVANFQWSGCEWMRVVFVLGSFIILPLQSAPLNSVFFPIDAVHDCEFHFCQLSMVRIWVVFLAVPDLHIRSMSISVIGVSPAMFAPANAFYLAVWLCDDLRHLK